MTEPAPAVPSIPARLASRPFAVMFVLALLAWLPGLLTLPPLDRDESRFAVASRQMAETGNYVDIRFGSATRYNKPVGIYWLQAASVKVVGALEQQAGNDIRAYRIPSFLGGLLALVLAFWCARAFASREIALAAASLLAVTLLLSAESEIATTDACLLASIVGAQAVLLRAYLAARDSSSEPPARATILAGWAAVGAGILIKGPIVLAVVGLTALAVSLWDRDWRWLSATKPLAGLAVVALIVAPWAVAIDLTSHGAFYRQSLGHDFGAKILAGQETHGAPPGYYLALLSLTFWPATLFLLPAIGAAAAARQNPAIRFLISWAAPTWIMFELVPTKLPHYILPAYPALALLAACWIMEPPVANESWRARLLRYVACAQYVLVAVAVGAAAIVLPARYGGATAWSMAAAACAGVGAASLGAILFLRRNLRGAICAAALSAVVFYPLLVLGAAPRLPDLWVSSRIAAATARDRPANGAPVAVAGYAEPSLIFLLGTGIDLEDGANAAETVAHHGGLAIVEGRERDAFLRRLSNLGAAAGTVDEVSGLDYSNGHREHLTFYRVTQAPDR